MKKEAEKMTVRLDRKDTPHRILKKVLCQLLYRKGKIVSPCLEPIKIFHLCIFVKDRTLLFQRDCGIWSFLSGELEFGESWFEAASREAFEEANLHIGPDKIEMTEYCFSGISPKRKRITGCALVNYLPHFCPSDLDLNTFEIKDWCLVSVQSALQLLEKGFPEAKRGLDFLVKRGIVPYLA
jgi:8-oxo-dGTP pyrophosphatase MutT (NUDIX family)